MIAVKNQSYGTLLFAILLIGAEFSQALHPTSLAYSEADVSDQADNGSFLQTRVLQSGSTICDNTYCTASGTVLDKYYLSFAIEMRPQAKITIDVEVGTPKYVLQMALSSTVSVSMQTTMDQFPGSWSDSSSFSSWSRSLPMNDSPFSSRRLRFVITNKSYIQTTVSTLAITVNSREETSSTFNFDFSTSSWVAPVSGAIGAFILIFACIATCVCVRRARFRRMARRQNERARSSYEVRRPDQENESQPQMQQPQAQPQAQPQPLPQQPAQFAPLYQSQYQPQYQPQYQGQIQAPIMYQPINPHAPQNYQFPPGVQLVQVPIQDYQVQNYPGYQLAPMMQPMPMQVIMQDPNEGPLTEFNFDYRFPEAPLENFASSFPQKTCSICLEDLKANQNCRQLYCEHIYHTECAKSWLLNQMVKQNHGFCPNCNKNMTFVVERAKS